MLFYIFVVLAVTGELVKAHPDGPMMRILDAAQEADKKECMINTGVEESELQRPPNGAPSENILCFMKCVSEKSNVLKSDGTVNMVQFSSLPKRPQVDADRAKKIDECIQTVKVVECTDMVKIYECFRP